MRQLYCGQLFGLPRKLMTFDRDYNHESKDVVGHQYAYRFDFEVMHHYILRTIAPFFVQGNILELGSYRGDFTERLLPHFSDISCVDASSEAIAVARARFGTRITFYPGLFETISVPRTFSNISIIHTLEHLDDPVLVLRRIRNEWLAALGRVFIVCPNAMAPSRQIAVKMGIISHNSAVTAPEALHGHRRTYSLDTLERDARHAGLKVVYRTGVFFKALANFQWDQLLDTKIISPEYLDGCYDLGQQYPELCASILLVCERGD